MQISNNPQFDLFPRTIGPFNEVAVSNFLQTFLIVSQNFEDRKVRQGRIRTNSEWIREECHELALSASAGDSSATIEELADVFFVTINELASTQDVCIVHALEAFLIGAATKWMS